MEKEKFIEKSQEVLSQLESLKHQLEGEVESRRKQLYDIGQRIQIIRSQIEAQAKKEAYRELFLFVKIALLDKRNGKHPYSREEIIQRAEERFIQIP